MVRTRSLREYYRSWAKQLRSLRIIKTIIYEYRTKYKRKGAIKWEKRIERAGKVMYARWKLSQSHSSKLRRMTSISFERIIRHQADYYLMRSRAEHSSRLRMLRVSFGRY